MIEKTLKRLTEALNEAEDAEFEMLKQEVSNLTDDVPDEPPTEILKEEHGHKILVDYEVEREQEWDDEYGHFEMRYYVYDVQICVKE